MKSPFTLTNTVVCINAHVNVYTHFFMATQAEKKQMYLQNTLKNIAIIFNCNYYFTNLFELCVGY